MSKLERRILAGVKKGYDETVEETFGNVDGDTKGHILREVRKNLQDLIWI